MINSVTQKPYITDKKWQIYKKLVSSTGYAAMGFGTVCGLTGLNNVKFKNKMKVHKYSAYLAGLFTFLHFGIAKGLDKFLYKSE